MKVIEQLKEQAAQDMERVKSFQAAIAALENAVNDLGRHGYQAALTRANSGVTCLSVDLCRHSLANIARADETPTPVPDAPVPDTARVPESEPAPQLRGQTGWRSAGKVTRKPAKAAAKAKIKTTQLVGQNRAFAVEMLAKGYGPADIARQMGRNTKQISNLKARAKVEIAECAARLAGKSVPKPAAPVAAAPKPVVPVTEMPVPKIPGDQMAAMSAAERTINAHLNALGYVDLWTPARDLEVVRALCGGARLDIVAAGLKVTPAAVAARFKVLNTNRGSLEHQSRLVRVLKLRAGNGADAGQVAAE